MKQKSYERFFRNFSHPVRMRIVFALMEKPLSVTEICKATGEEQSNISHHLTSMIKCKILAAKKTGKKRIYSINKELVAPLFEMVNNHALVACGSCGGDCSRC